MVWQEEVLSEGSNGVAYLLVDDEHRIESAGRYSWYTVT